MVFVKDLACDNRQAWVQAALSFPEKKHARKLVTLYLGCTGSTANVERTLKKVAIRCQHSPNVEYVLSDLVICDVHAPRVADVTYHVGQTTPDDSKVASDIGQTISGVGQTALDIGIGQTISSVGQAAPNRIRPKGKYLEAIRKLYKDVFGGRAFRKVPKQRRDKGLKHSRPDGKLSEAEFNRLRDQDHFKWWWFVCVCVDA